MEDAHISKPNLTNDSSIFGVFDGHGGIYIYIIIIISKINLILLNI